MTKIDAELVGAKELARAVRKAEDDLAEELKQSNREAADLVAATARPLVPVRTGALAASLRTSATLRWSTVRVGSRKVPYAPPIHWGWPRMNIDPQPFLYEALDSRIPDVMARYEAARDRLVDAINRST